MKISIITIIATFMMLQLNVSAQDKPKKTETITFHVSSACGLCEKTIEKAMDTKGVINADYNLDTQLLTVTYKPSKITEEQMHHLLNEAGYDTEKSKCTDEQYSRVHECCKYRELPKH